MLDTVREVETPEGVTLRLRLAGPVPRGLAWTVDFLIRALGTLIALTVLSAFGKAGMGTGLIVLFLAYWSYNVLFELLHGGQTIGKAVMNLRVLNDDGVPVGWLASIVRNLLRTVDMFPICYGFGLASMLIDRDFRRLGDIVAGTVVVHVSTSAAAAAMPDAAPAAPAVLLQPDEQGALQAFAERRERLTPERQVELAALLTPLTGLSGQEAVRRLFSYANWVVGRR